MDRRRHWLPITNYTPQDRLCGPVGKVYNVFMGWSGWPIEGF